jgi:hypothetical protein
MKGTVGIAVFNAQPLFSWLGRRGQMLIEFQITVDHHPQRGGNLIQRRVVDGARQRVGQMPGVVGELFLQPFDLLLEALGAFGLMTALPAAQRPRRDAGLPADVGAVPAGLVQQSERLPFLIGRIAHGQGFLSLLAPPVWMVSLSGEGHRAGSPSGW